MSGAHDQAAVLSALRAWPGDLQVRGNMLRKAAGLSAPDYAAAVRALRFAGKMDWDRLALAPSMLSQEMPERGVGHGSRDLPRDGIGHPPVQAPVPADGPAIDDDLARAEAIYAGTPNVTEQVKAEARAAAVQRGAARTGGSTAVGGLTLSYSQDAGALLQEIALRDDPAMAIHALRIRWNPLWRRICAHAAQAGQRPFSNMLELIEIGLAAGDSHGRA
jgi:hypothetical protein